MEIHINAKGYTGTVGV